MTGYILLQANNKKYSIESIDAWHETKMTSSNEPAPLAVSASSQYSADYPAWRAFDGSIANVGSLNNCWITANGVKVGHIQLDFGRTTTIRGFSLTPRQNSTAASGINCMPKKFNFLGSNDGINYFLISEYKNEIWSAYTEERKFVLSKPVKYRFYKFEILENNGGTYVSIGEIKFLKGVVMSELPTGSLQNFINYGKGLLSNLDQSINIKTYVTQDEVSKNDKGLRTSILDRKPLYIEMI
ncbi:discoidin domain-containing protein [Lysinibacillus fusiformis]|uniref:discoidin domain-containing protein n=1 Tax=Lysinibacillus fusiformis TaxID=28031 RepID=UPI003557BE34